MFDSRVSQGATGAFAGPLNGGQEVIYKVAGPFGAAQGGGNTDCDVPVGATSAEINVVAVNALNEGNLRVTDGSPSSTGGVVNYNNMTPKLNTANAVIVPLNASGRLVVTPNCGVGCAADTTEVRGVVLGYFTTAMAERVAAMETLLAGVSRTTHNGYDTLRFNQVNLQLVNGTNQTYSDSNGYGNLIVGYDENPNGRARTGSHDIVVGDNHGWTENGGVVFGFGNQISGTAASVTGGQQNIASDSFASVVGGRGNTASSNQSTVTGGQYNTVGDFSSSVTGGANNQALGLASTVSGGSSRTASGVSDWRAGSLFESF